MQRDPIVIVGAGPAGSATALRLLREAPALRHRVLLLDKAAFPREKFCAGGLGDRGWRCLAAIGAAPDEAPAVPVSAITLHTGRCSLSARPGPALGRVVRRESFDAALVGRAIDAGAALHTDTTVLGLTDDGDSVRLETSRGEIRASAVIGADGVGSVVRRAMGLPAGRLRAMVLEVDTDAAAGDPPRDTLVFDARDAALPGYAWDFPTLLDGAPLWCRGVYVLRSAAGGGPGSQPADRVDLAAWLDAWLGAKGLRLAGLRQKRFAERGWEPRAAVVQGRCLLVGEAAGIDPLTGEGIAQALEGGVRLGAFLAAGPWDPRRLAGWGAALGGSRLGWDLSLRSRLVSLAYGPERARTEAALAGNAALLEAGARHWAGLPIGAGLLARAAWALATPAPPRAEA